MKIVALICRILLGLAFVVFGANILHPFMKQPPMSGLPLQFMMVVAHTGWMKIIGLCQLLGGLAVLSGGALPFGLCLLCPVTVNILCFHLFLMGGAGIAGGVIATVLELILIYAYRGSFAGILTVKASPTA